MRFAMRSANCRSPGPTGPSRGRSNGLTVLANARRFQGDLEGALQAIRQAREIAQRATPHADETKRMIERYPLLLREAFILGEDRAISLNRPDEAAALLREAFDMHEAGARRDPKDFTSCTRSRRRGASSATSFAGERHRRQSPCTRHRAGAAGRDARQPGHAPRPGARSANSSYALRRLDRIAEARRRIDEALALLEQTKDYPTERIALDSQVSAVLQAAAD